MKASRIGLVFASLLLAGLVSQAANAACPCAVPACTAQSNGSGPNGCAAEPLDLLIPPTDGKGCIEKPPAAAPGDDCAACIGGAVRSIDDDGTPNNPNDDIVVLVQGCACTANPLGGWNCVSTDGVEVDLGTMTPTVGMPPVVVEPMPPAGIPGPGIPGDGTSVCEMLAADGCTLP